MGAPAALSHNPLRILAGDVRAEWAGRGEYPPGDTSFSLSRTGRWPRDPLPRPALLLRALRPGVHGPDPARAGRVRAGPRGQPPRAALEREQLPLARRGFRELEPLLGDGLLTIDGAYHRRARHIMLPAFHHAQVAAASEVMIEEADRALDGWQPGETIDVYAWARGLAMRIAMRALLGLDPDGGTGELAAREFERALELLRHRVPAARPARPGHAVAADARGAPSAGRDRLPRDRAPPRCACGRPTTSSAC